jgi:hypothetical protein
MELTLSLPSRNEAELQTLPRAPLCGSDRGESVNGAKLHCAGKCNGAEQVIDIEEAISMGPGSQQHRRVRR